MSGLLPNLENLPWKGWPCRKPRVFPDQCLTPRHTDDAKASHSGPEEQQRQQSHSVRGQVRRPTSSFSRDPDSGGDSVEKRRAGSPAQLRDSHVPGTHHHPHHKRSCAESPAGAKEAKGTVLESSNAGVFKQVVLHLSFFHYFFFSPCFPSFLSSLGLLCCARAFSNCGKWGLLSSCGTRASHCSGFSC